MNTKNKFIVTKIGEVLAFSRNGNDTFSKSEEALTGLIDSKQTEEISSSFKQLEEQIIAFCNEEDILEEVEKAAGETNQKVTAMRDAYIEGKWNEPTEVLEWMGFYTGAALVHWRLVAGAAKQLDNTELIDLTKNATDFYNTLISSDEHILYKIGAAKLQ